MGIWLPRLISNGFIWQKGKPFRLWGRAEPGEQVSAVLETAEGRELIGSKAFADAGGSFEMMIDAPYCAEALCLRVASASGQRRVEDIRQGYVFLCGGQSNMELGMARVLDAYPEEREETFGEIRTFKIQAQTAYRTPLEEPESGAWVRAGKESIASFSATGYFFAKALHEACGEPVGFIDTSLGGSRIESWMSREMLAGMDELLEEADRYGDRNFVRERIARNGKQAGAWYADLDAADRGLAGNWKEGLPPEERIPSDFPGEVVLPCFLKDMGLPGFCGSLWLEKRFFLTGEEASSGEALLLLGTLVDRDEVFLNGTPVGRTEYQYPPRRYRLPAGVLRAGENRLVIRLTVEKGKGRITPGKEYCLRLSAGKSVDLKGVWRAVAGCSCAPSPETDFVLWKPVGLYNAMVHPCRRFSLAGILWYQGESNAEEAWDYTELTRRLVAGYRRDWGDESLPYFFVQLPNFVIDLSEEESWPRIREQQRLALSIPGTGMAVTMDLGEDNDLHPLNKMEVGRRLSLLVRALLLGEKVEYSGPWPERCLLRQEEGRTVVRITLSHAQGLCRRERPASGRFGPQQGTEAGPRQDFRLFTPDGACHVPSEAKLCPEAPAIECIFPGLIPGGILRYLYANTAYDELVYNGSGLPMGPFVMETEVWNG